MAEYSFNKGKEIIQKYQTSEFQELREVIASVDALQFKTKVSKEKTMTGQMLYDPINAGLKPIKARASSQRSDNHQELVIFGPNFPLQLVLFLQFQMPFEVLIHFLRSARARSSNGLIHVAIQNLFLLIHGVFHSA